MVTEVPLDQKRAALQALTSYALKNEKDNIVSTLRAAMKSFSGFDFRRIIAMDTSGQVTTERLVGVVFMTPFQKYLYVSQFQIGYVFLVLFFNFGVYFGLQGDPFPDNSARRWHGMCQRCIPFVALEFFEFFFPFLRRIILT
jgi:hypothetical protein